MLLLSLSAFESLCSTSCMLYFVCIPFSLDHIFSNLYLLFRSAPLSAFCLRVVSLTFSLVWSSFFYGFDAWYHGCPFEAYVGSWSLSLVCFHSAFYFFFLSSVWKYFRNLGNILALLKKILYILPKTRPASRYPTSLVKPESLLRPSTILCSACVFHFWLSAKNGLYVRGKHEVVLPSIHALCPTVFSKLV